jgi:hypothetical protein
VHDSGGVQATIEFLIVHVAGSLGHFKRLFKPVRASSNLKSLRDSPAATAVDRALEWRRERLVQLARAPEPTRVPGLFRPEFDHSQILSMRVTMYDSWPTKRLFPAGSAANTKRVWPNDANTGKDVVICPVDHGELRLTRHAFIFSGASRHREYPLDELTRISSTERSIALATRRGRTIAYFEGINTARVGPDTSRGDQSARPKLQAPLKFTGKDIRQLVGLLRSASILEPA